MSAVEGVDDRLTSYGALFAVGGFPRLAASGFLVRTAAGMWQLALVLEETEPTSKTRRRRA